MSDTTNDTPTHAMIALFGGVRPLAKKLDIAASTVQGWKLRDHIPEAYHAQLTQIAQDDQQQNAFAALLTSLASVPAEPIASAPSAPIEKSIPAARPMPRNPNDHYAAMPQASVRYWIMSSLATFGFTMLVIVILVGVFFGRDIFNAIFSAEPVAVTETAPVAPPTVTNDDTALHSNLQDSRAAIDETLNSVKKMKNATPADQTVLLDQIDRIEAVVGSLRERVDTLDKALQEKGVDATAIRDQMADISRRDVLAAALLLGVAQVHGMLDQQARFSDDLVFLKALLASDPEMVKSLDKLSPFAEKGLMTREQMISVLNDVAKETINVTQEQPNLTWSQKLWVAFNNVIEVRKKSVDDPQVAMATPHTQVKQARDLLANDQFAEAATILQDYQGPDADKIMDVAYNMQGRDAAQNVLNALMEKGQALLNVDHLKTLLMPAPQSANPAALY